MTDVRQRIPVVGGLGYVERVRRLPSTFTATLVPEPDNRYFRHALAVMASGDKVGYVAPEIAVRYYDVVAAHPEPVTCPGRRSAAADHNTSGVELLLDFTGLPVAPAE
jgi:hypothetical protein